MRGVALSSNEASSHPKNSEQEVSQKKAEKITMA